MDNKSGVNNRKVWFWAVAIISAVLIISVGGVITQGNSVGGVIMQGNSVGGVIMQGNSVGGVIMQGNSVGGGITQGESVAYGEKDRAELLILMYHNIIPDKYPPNKYEIRLSELERDFRYIAKAGYACVDPRQLMEYTIDKKTTLPTKCVMLTFDDGFYNYNRYLVPLLDKYNLKGVISVVGSFTKYNKSTSATSRYTYMDYDDMASIARSPRITIANHSDTLHYIKDNRTGVKRKKGENVAEYKAMFERDCKSLEDKLATVGIKPNCYTYPYGAYCQEAESLIKERGYKMSLSCNEKVNIITRDPSSLYLLGRYNRHGTSGSAEQLLSKHLQLSAK